jgi:hypothetical protein
MSSLWHTFAQIAHEGTMKCMACLDYVGISVLIAASVVVTEYYGFYCESTFRNSYIAATAMFGVAGVVVPWLSWFDQKGMHSLFVGEKKADEHGYFALVSSHATVSFLFLTSPLSLESQQRHVGFVSRSSSPWLRRHCCLSSI